MGFGGPEGDITKEHEEMFGGDEYVIFHGIFHRYIHVKTYNFFILNMFNSLSIKLC